MRIAFYAPLKSPEHSVPSGDRRVARLLVQALERAGHEVELASSLRTFEPAGDRVRQAALREEGIAIARDLSIRWRGPGCTRSPDLWFTYHAYYKSPDWIGPAVSTELGIPYVIAEASYAPKRAGGPWSMGHDATADAIRASALVLCPAKDDVACVEELVRLPGRVAWLPPFLDARPYRAAMQDRETHRSKIAESQRLDASVPWIAVAAMMRPGDKLASYEMLAASLAAVADLPWQVLVAGDGIARPEVEAAFQRAVPGRVRFLGERNAEELAAVYAASDLCVWPAVNEAYGMAMLEAQAAGIPVVSRAVRGVPDVVLDGVTGLLAPGDEAEGLGRRMRLLLQDRTRREALGRAAARFVAEERSIETAACALDRALRGVCGA